MTFPIEAVRARFPALARTDASRRRAYLDAPGGTQVCAAAITRMVAHLEAGTANAGGAFATSRETDALARAALLGGSVGRACSSCDVRCPILSAAATTPGAMIQPDASNAAHVVQLALTPIFLLTGVASLLNVFTTRLGRIADQVDRLSSEPAKRPLQLARLRLRSASLDIAVLLAATAGGLTCCAALTLFFSALRSAARGKVLFALFGAALICAIAALSAFSFEMVLAGRTVRDKVDADAADAGPAG